MMFILFRIIISTITSNASVDRKVLSLKGENDSLSQDQFRFFGSKDVIVSITIEGIHTLEHAALAECSKLTTVIFNGNCLKNINGYCFKQCKSLESIEIPYGTSSIGYGCFTECSKLNSITFPSSISKNSFLSKGFEFYKCHGLRKFIVKGEDSTLSTNSDGSILITNKKIAYFCANIETIVIPAEVEEISKFFINELNAIQNIIFEEGSNLTTVSDYAFRSTRIITMIFPPKLRVIGSKIFDFTKIQTLFLPKSLEEVSSDLFVGQPLTNLTIEEGIKALNVDPNGAIFNKDNSVLMYIKPETKSIEIKENTTEVPMGILQGVKTLTGLTVKSSHSKFYDLNNILYNNTGLVAAPGGIEHAVLDSRCTKIFRSAFGGCSKLISIDFNGSQITLISQSAFGSCSSLVKFEIPSTVEYIGSYCFSSASLEKVKLKFGPNLDIIDEYAFHQSKVSEVDFSKCTKLVTIRIYAFTNNYYLQNIILPKMNVINTKSFLNCWSLTSVSIPEDVSKIDDEAFASCSSLSEITFKGNNLKIIRSSAFKNCNLSKVKIPDSVLEIHTGAFAFNANMKEVTFTENSQLKILYTDTFEGCASVKEIFLGDNVQNISIGALSHMMSLTNINVSSNNGNFRSIDGVLHSLSGEKLIMCPGGIVSLNISSLVSEFEKSSFLGCSKLISIQMSEEQKIKKIPEQTFYGCTSLKSITLPRLVEEVASEGFDGCSSLKEVIFKKGSQLSILGSSSFRGCSKLESVIFEDGSELRLIESGAFEGCTNLNIFTFGEKVEEIRSKAFSGCPLKRIVFNSSLKSIGERCFEGSKAVEIILPGNVSSLGYMCFNGSKELRRIIYCGDNNLDGVSVMTKNDINSGRIIFYVKPTYQFDTAGGFTPHRVIDGQCHIPTLGFTRSNVSCVEPVAFILGSVLSDQQELEEDGGGLPIKNGMAEFHVLREVNIL